MSQRVKAVFAILIFVSAALPMRSAEAQQAAANPRIALVIGNATYRDAALATTANDAGLVAQTLQAAGFDVVGARDLDGQSLRTAFRDFLQKAAAAGPDMQAFVYLAGRGIQYNGDNYFVPVDAQINRDADVPIEGLRLSDFSHALAATPGRARIIVLDAARPNPYAPQGSPLAPGLALVDPEPGELIAFNAAPGTLAGDEEGPYGVYGKTLAGAIRQGGVDIAQAFDQTRVSVNAETQGALLPWSASKLDGPFYVFERAADAPPAAPPLVQTERRPISSFSAADAYAAALERDTIEGYREFLAAYPNSDQARRVRAILAVRREAAYWRRTVGADTPRAYWTYLRTYPKGPHTADARRRLAMLSAGFEPPADFRPETFADLPPPPPDELVYDDRPIYAFDDFGPPPPPPPVQYVYIEDDDWRDLPPPPPPAEIGVLPVLGVAIPIAIGAVAFHGRFHHDGIAPRGESRWRQPPPAPPPLPANIKPVAPPAPVAAAGPVANAAVVKPLRPIGQHRPQGASVAAPGNPAGAPPAPAPTSPANPVGTAAPAAPGQAAKPLPVPPAAGNPAAALPAAGTKPRGAPPAGVAAPVAPTAPGGKSLPAAPSPNAAGPAAAPSAPVVAKPPPGTAPAVGATTVPGGKPLPAAPSPNAAKPAAAPVAPVVAKPPGTAPTVAAPAVPAAPGKLSPAPTSPALAKPSGGAGPAAVQATSPGAKPALAPAAPVAAPVRLAPNAMPKPPAPTPASVPMPKPNVVAKPPAAAPLTAPAPAALRQPPPVVHAPPPAAAAPVAPRPAPPPVVHAPAPPTAAAAPVAPRPAPPAVHAPAPAMVAAPRPPAAAAPPPAPRQAPPVVRAQPAPAQSRACGMPGVPPCPK
ncbi:MAG TPA: caspase family protein [Roseiarcus sp.]